MLAIDNALGPLFALILIGLFLGALDYPGGDFWARAERLIYYILFPALLVHVLATADVTQVPVIRLAFVCLGPTLLAAASLWQLRRHFSPDNTAFTSVFQGTVRFNSYVAIAGAEALHGSIGTTVAAVALALLVPTVNVLSVLCFVLTSRHRTSFAHSLLVLLRNPLILACILGIVLNLTGIGLPGWSESVFALTARAALPLALIAVGVALRPASLLRSGRALWLTSLVKLAILPAITLGLAVVVGLNPVSRDVALLFAACSTATSAYILSRQLGGDSELMASLITAQTLLAMITLPIWLGLLS